VSNNESEAIYIILNTSRKHVNYVEDKNKVPMHKPYNIQNTNICNSIFHISFVKALLINEGETTRGEMTHGAKLGYYDVYKCHILLARDFILTIQVFSFSVYFCYMFVIKVTQIDLISFIFSFNKVRENRKGICICHPEPKWKNKYE
jgi:hypothetical protein